MTTVSRAPIPKASSIIVTALRSMILQRRLPVGTRLPSVDELMAEYGLGRVTVREGLRILENDGLISIRRGPSGGIFVRQVDIRQVSEALGLLFNSNGITVGEFADFRLLVEPEIARLAALNATPEERHALTKEAEMEREVWQSPEAWQSAGLHNVIAGACGNGVFELVMKAMQAPLSGHFRHNLISHEDEEITAQAHAKIAKCVAEGDAPGAEKAMRRHLEAWKEYIVRHGLENESIFPTI